MLVPVPVALQDGLTATGVAFACLVLAAATRRRGAPELARSARRGGRVSPRRRRSHSSPTSMRTRSPVAIAFWLVYAAGPLWLALRNADLVPAGEPAHVQRGVRRLVGGLPLRRPRTGDRAARRRARLRGRIGRPLPARPRHCVGLVGDRADARRRRRRVAHLRRDADDRVGGRGRDPRVARATHRRAALPARVARLARPRVRARARLRRAARRGCSRRTRTRGVRRRAPRTRLATALVGLCTFDWDTAAKGLFARLFSRPARCATVAAPRRVRARRRRPPSTRARWRSSRCRRAGIGATCSSPRSGAPSPCR